MGELVFAWVAVFFEGVSWFLGPSEGMLVFKNSFSRSLRDGAGRRPSEGMLVVSDSIHSQSNRPRNRDKGKTHHLQEDRAAKLLWQMRGRFRICTNAHTHTIRLRV
jgi:hypothetical protein